MHPDPRTLVPPQIRALTTLRALWVPKWYNLDHEIALGWQDSLRFFVTPDPYVLEVARDAGKSEFDAVFFTGFPSDGNWFTLFGTVTSITHEQLGAIHAVLFNGWDYMVVPVDGPPLIVSAEAEPGTVLDAATYKWTEPPNTANWIMQVTIHLDNRNA